MTALVQITPHSIIPLFLQPPFVLLLSFPFFPPSFIASIRGLRRDV